MYNSNFSNSFVKWAIKLFLFPLFVGGKILKFIESIFKKDDAE